jgi:hypothetical protein
MQRRDKTWKATAHFHNQMHGARVRVGVLSTFPKFPRNDTEHNHWDGQNSRGHDIQNIYSKLLSMLQFSILGPVQFHFDSLSLSEFRHQCSCSVSMMSLIKTCRFHFSYFISVVYSH